MAGRERSFRYQERSKDDVRERANARSGDFDSYINPKYRMYKVKTGKNIIRILPPTWENAKHYGYDIYVNYQVGADNQSYLSLSKMKQQRDPLAEARQAAEREGDDDLAKSLRPTKRILMWIIDRSAEDEGPLLWAAPFTVDKAFANLAFDEDTNAVVFVDHPTKGTDIRFYKEGEGMTTKYDASKMKLLEKSPLSDDDDKAAEWLAFVEENPVPACLQYYSYDHIAAVYNGKAPAKEAEAEADNEAEEAAIYKKGGRKPSLSDEVDKDWDTKMPRPVHDPEDDEPARPKGRKPVTDPDDGPAYETDEEPAPKGRGRPKLAEPDEEPIETGSLRDRIRRRHSAAAGRADE
jgi:hypothetical protein